MDRQQVRKSIEAGDGAETAVLKSLKNWHDNCF
jgi:hypothetical protein